MRYLELIMALYRSFINLCMLIYLQTALYRLQSELESGAMTGPAVHCVKLLVRERVLVDRIRVR
jgi:hypothetical protein